MLHRQRSTWSRATKRGCGVWTWDTACSSSVLAGAPAPVTGGLLRRRRARSLGRSGWLGRPYVTPSPNDSRGPTAETTSRRRHRRVVAVGGHAERPLVPPRSSSPGDHHERSRTAARRHDHCGRWTVGKQNHPHRQRMVGRPGCPGRPSMKRMSGGDLLSHPVSRAVPSAQKGLASGFGMGPGVSPSP